MTLFPLDLGPGIAEDESWISYAVPEALVLDLMADDFFVPVGALGYELYARERGFDGFAATPHALKRALAQDLYAEFMAVGEIDRVDDALRVTLRIHRVDNGSLAGETVHEGTDFLALVDEMSGPVKAALRIPPREGIEDLPVRERLSENATAAASRSGHRIPEHRHNTRSQFCRRPAGSHCLPCASLWKPRVWTPR